MVVIDLRRPRMSVLNHKQEQDARKVDRQYEYDTTIFEADVRSLRSSATACCVLVVLHFDVLNNGQQKTL